MATTSTSTLFTRSRVLSNARGTPKRLLAASADSRRLVDSAVISKSSASDLKAGMCACAAQPRSGLAPMMPTRIKDDATFGPRSGRLVEQVSSDLPPVPRPGKDEELPVCFGAAHAGCHDCRRARRVGASVREIAPHLQLVDGEVDRDPNVLEDRVVGAADCRPASRRRKASRHEDAVGGIELFDPTRVTGIEGRLITGQQRVNPFVGSVLRPGDGAGDDG